MKLINSTGKIYYGLHFYSGLAQYQDSPDEMPYRVYLNENTLRSMDSSFAGKPIYVDHVDDVPSDIDEVRKDADGWVIESFFNSSDGKHWVKFIIVSEKAERAIQNGMRLSNAYVPSSFAKGGVWNGIPYDKEIVEAEYEHLAIVRNPRYEESEIKTPEEFKAYNESQTLELKKIANSKQMKGTSMKFSFFKQTKVEQKIDPDLLVTLPKSGKTVALSTLINEADVAKEEKKNEDDDSSMNVADDSHMVKMHDGSYMKIKDMLDQHKSMKDELSEMKGKKKEDSKEKDGEEIEDSASETEMDSHEKEVEGVEHDEEMKDDLEENPEDAVHDDEDDGEDKKKKALQLDEEDEKEVEEAKKKDSKKKNDLAKEKADRLRKAHLNAIENEQETTVELSVDRVERGRMRYGSG